MADFDTFLRRWKWAVKGDHKGGWPERIETHSHAEYAGWCEALRAAQIAAEAKGYPCKMGGTSNQSGGFSQHITASGQRLTVAYVPKPRQQAVTATSRESYAKVNLGAKCVEVAEAALQVAAQFNYATDNEVARVLNCPAALVSARRNDIENAGRITLNGTDYRLCMLVKTVQDRFTKRRTNAWALKPVGAEQPKQASLFQ